MRENAKKKCDENNATIIYLNGTREKWGFRKRRKKREGKEGKGSRKYILGTVMLYLPHSTV